MGSTNSGAEPFSVYVQVLRVCLHSLAVAAIGAAVVWGSVTVFDGTWAGAAILAVAGASLLFALLRLLTVWRWAGFSGPASIRKAYLRIDRSGIRLLDTLQLPWSAITFLKISRLGWPRRTYLLVGLNSRNGTAGDEWRVPPHLMANNVRIARVSQESTGSVMDPQSFLALCLEANWSALFPLLLTQDSRQIAHAAEHFMHLPPAVIDRDGARQLFQSGQAAYQGGELAQARAIFQRVIELDSEHDEAYFMLSLIALGEGATKGAEAFLRRALALREHPAYASNLGLLLQENGEPEEAESWFRLALSLAPDDANVVFCLANLLKGDGRFVEAEAMYQRVLEIDPGNAPAKNNLGMLCWKQGRLAEAMACYQGALSIDPDLVDAHGNLGIVQKELGLFDRAEDSYRRAIALQPGFAHGHNNLGLLLQETNRQLEAAKSFERALELEPAYSIARYNLSLTRLALEDYEQGLPDLEARYDPNSPDSHVKLPYLAFPQWHGEDLAGKTLLIWPEQGFGDFVQFARFFPLLKMRGLARLSICCHPALAPLLRTVDGVDALITDEAELVDHDYWVFLMSLALHCGARIDNIPGVPYLGSLPERTPRWQSDMGGPGFKVGLVWRGAPGHKNDANRSLPSLDVLAPLFNIEGVQCFSLQKGEGEAEAEAAAASGRLCHLGGAFVDLADTAAVVSQLDLVICVDTVLAHVAGGMGKRCWVLLPAVGCDWRWHVGRADSPWYPGVMRLFRQRVRGDWSEAVGEMAEALRSLHQESASRTDHAALS